MIYVLKNKDVLPRPQSQKEQDISQIDYIYDGDNSFDFEYEYSSVKTYKSNKK